MRTNISTGTPWEERVGYSRAVRVGNHVVVTGTLAADEHGNILGVGDPYTQTAEAIRKIERALVEAGAALRDVVRTRMYVTDLSHSEDVGRAHREFFGDIRPCATMIEVSALFTDEALIEIEVDAIIAE